MKYIYTLIAILWSILSFGQDFNNYTPLKCTGDLPEDFTKLTFLKVKEGKSKTSVKEGLKTKRTKDEFILQANYATDQLLLSGKVLFNDPVTDYINAVAGEVLNSEPALKEELRFYALKSNVTNAFATDQGIIFVTLGLIAQLENEAQLAYILSHEIIHYKNKHAISAHLENERIVSKNGRYKRSHDETIKKMSRYSKDLEFQADSLGFYLYEKSNYSLREVNSAFDVMQYAYLPFDEVPYDFNFLETEYLKIPDELVLDTLRPIEANDNYDDSRSTHPNIKKRRVQLSKLLRGKNLDQGKNFLFPEEKFITIRDICRFESIHLDLIDRNYSNALYSIFLLQQKYPKSSYLALNTAKALYGISKYKTFGKYDDIATHYSNYEGNVQRPHYFFDHITDEQINLITLRHIWGLKKKHTNSYLDEIFINIIDDLSAKYHLNVKTIEDIIATAKTAKEKPPKVIANVQTNTLVNEPASLSKYDKIRIELNERENDLHITEEEKEEMVFHFLGMEDMMQDEDFTALFSNVVDAVKKREEEKSIAKEAHDKLSSYQQKRLATMEANRRKRKGVALGIDNLVVVDPFYFAVDNRRGIKLINSEREQVEFIDQVKKCGETAKLNIEVVSSKKVKNNNGDAFNDFVVMNDWLNERLNHDNLEILPTENEYLKSVMQKYDTDYFCYMGVLTFKQQEENIGAKLILCVFLYPIAPIILADAVTPEHDTLLFTIIFNAKSGKVVFEETTELKTPANDGYLNSIIYDLMLQIKKAPK